MFQLVSLAKSINELCKDLDITYHVNSGGCCFIAYNLAKHLETLKLPYSLMLFDSIYRNENSVIDEIHNKVRNNACPDSITGQYACSHYCIVLKGEILNGTVDDDDKDYQLTLNDINAEDINWIYKNTIWNTYYNVKNNKRIVKIINSFFEPYEKSKN
jgi:hypothetical protein